MREPNNIQVDDSITFDQAVRSYVWHDFIAGLRARLRMTVESLVSLALGFTVLAKYGSDDAAFDFTLEKALVVPIALVVMMVIHGLWSWASAARHIFKAQQVKAKEQSLQIETLSQSIAENEHTTAVTNFIEPAHITAIRKKLSAFAHRFSPEASMFRTARMAPVGELTPRAELMTFLRSAFCESIVSECDAYFSGDGLPQGEVSAFISGLADSLSPELLDKIGRSAVSNETSEKRVAAAKDSIRSIADMIALEPPGAIGCVPGPKPFETVDWKQETKRRLRAIVKKDICDDYESILRVKQPRRPAKAFLQDLADTLAYSQLRE